MIVLIKDQVDDITYGDIELKIVVLVKVVSMTLKEF